MIKSKKKRGIFSLYNRLSLRTRQVLLSIVVGLLPFVVIAVVAFYDVSGISANERNVSSYYNLQNVANTLDSTITNFDEMTKYIIGNAAVRAFMTGNSTDADYYPTVVSNAQDALLMLPFSTKAVNGIILYTVDGRCLVSGSTFRQIALTDAERNQADKLRGQWFWSVDGGLSICRLLRDTAYVSNNLGYIKIRLDDSLFGNNFVTDDYWANASFILLDTGGTVLLDTLNDNLDWVLDSPSLTDCLSAKNNRVSFSVSHKGVEYYLMGWHLSDEHTIAVSVLQAVTQRFSKLQLALLISAALIALALFLVEMGFLRRWMTKPLQKLGHLMQDVEEGNYHVRFDARTNDEIGVLARKFNDMSERLQYLRDQVYQSTLKIKEAEIHALEAEINPHFLFNTLDVIYWTVAVSQNDTAMKMIKALSDTFRLTLERSRDGLTSLSNEILHVKGYLFIEETRLKEKLKYAVEVQEGLEKYRVMQFILQPLVENAVTHGIRDGQGEVLVDVCEQDGDLLLCVHNDGNVVNPETIDKLIHTEPAGRRGYALYNINERLQLNFGNTYGVTCRCPADGGTTFIIRHPIIAPEKENK